MVGLASDLRNKALFVLEFHRIFINYQFLQRPKGLIQFWSCLAGEKIVLNIIIIEITTLFQKSFIIPKLSSEYCKCRQQFEEEPMSIEKLPKGSNKAMKCLGLSHTVNANTQHYAFSTFSDWYDLYAIRNNSWENEMRCLPYQLLKHLLLILILEITCKGPRSIIVDRSFVWKY